MSSFKEKMANKAFSGRSEELDNLEKDLKVNMFLNGFVAGERDEQVFEQMASFDPILYPNVNRWVNYMKNKKENKWYFKFYL